MRRSAGQQAPLGGEGVDLIRKSVRLVTQELIEIEAAERIGAGRYERTEGRVTERNGARRGLPTTPRAGVPGRQVVCAGPPPMSSDAHPRSPGMADCASPPASGRRA
jgi:hypothetical protein